MKRLVLMVMLAAPLLMAPIGGCDRTVSEKETTKVKSDGTTVSEEKKTTVSPGGDTTTTTEKKVDRP